MCDQSYRCEHATENLPLANIAVLSVDGSYVTYDNLLASMEKSPLNYTS